MLACKWLNFKHFFLYSSLSDTLSLTLFHWAVHWTSFSLSLPLALFIVFFPRSRLRLTFNISSLKLRLITNLIANKWACQLHSHFMNGFYLFSMCLCVCVAKHKKNAPLLYGEILAFKFARLTIIIVIVEAKKKQQQRQGRESIHENNKIAFFANKASNFFLLCFIASSLFHTHRKSKLLTCHWWWNEKNRRQYKKTNTNAQMKFSKAIGLFWTEISLRLHSKYTSKWIWIF